MAKLLSGKASNVPEIPSLNRIRVETALSRFPIHRLAKKGSVAIDIQSGAADFKWEVTHNAKHGQPGPLAYKLDTLIINRRLDELGRPLPELIRIGSLSEICRMLGSSDTGPNIADLKRAFLQNAFAAITAKIRYKTKTGKEKWAEIGYTRYSVIFTGETLPDGSQADAVYVVLNPPYRDLLNHVEVRPLDYDYLMHLAPGPQRFYELISFQMYGALASGRPRAKMLYSEYCKCAPQTRYPDFDHMKKQMYKVHVPHRESGYIAKVHYEQAADSDGMRDWEMLYTPGPKAMAEYQAFTNRQVRPVSFGGSPASHKLHRREREPVQAELELGGGAGNCVLELIRRGLTRQKAEQLLATLSPGQEVMDQIEYVDFLIARAPSDRFHNPPGLYIRMIELNVVPPAPFESTRLRTLRELRAKAQDEERIRQLELHDAYGRYQRNVVDEYIATHIPASDYSSMVATEIRALRQGYSSMTRAQLEETAHRVVWSKIKASGRVEIMSLEEYGASQYQHCVSKYVGT